MDHVEDHRARLAFSEVVESYSEIGHFSRSAAPGEGACVGFPLTPSPSPALGRGEQILATCVCIRPARRSVAIMGNPQ